ncbi:MAG: hypothetical protein ACHREM_09255 [Polyangiales bacterium]
MKLRQKCLVLAIAALGTIGLAGFVHADTAHPGDDLNVHNSTGHDVIVILFQDDHVHLSETGGTQVASIKDGKAAVAHVPNCQFAVVLIDHEDVWHAEFHDCHSTDMTFTKDTGHAKRDPK